jgi:hypothetical protein
MMPHSHCLIPLDADNEWRDALSGVNHAFGHTRDFCYAMYLTTGLKTFLYCFEKDDLRILCPIVERSFRGYTDIAKPFGFSGFVSNGFCPEFMAYWNEFVQSKSYVSGYVSTYPPFDCSKMFDQSEIHLSGRIQVLNLKTSLEGILSGMTNTRRYQLKRVESLIPRLVSDRVELFAFLKDYYTKYMNGRQAPSYYYFKNETLACLLQCQNVIVAGVKESGQYVACMMFGYTSYIGDAFLHISKPEGRQYSALLYWYGIKTLVENGIPFVNFGGGEGGIYDFKRRFGCKDLPYYSIRQVYRENVYADLCRQTNTNHSIKDGYFPAYRN